MKRNRFSPASGPQIILETRTRFGTKKRKRATRKKIGRKYTAPKIISPWSQHLKKTRAANPHATFRAVQTIASLTYKKPTKDKFPQRIRRVHVPIPIGNKDRNKF